MKIPRRVVRVMVVVAAALLASVAFPGGTVKAEPAPPAPHGVVQNESLLAKQVRHRLLMLPWYGVFDNLQFEIQGGEVILTGQVVIPRTKYDAEGAVRNINGVTGVVNKIQVLPLSPMDNQIRRAEFRAIYFQPQLSRYAEGAIPQIHIIVDHGHVTLEGVVGSAADRNIAALMANGVPGVFSVTNNLRAG
jgi:osmotically-inducible protein OsmY